MTRHHNKSNNDYEDLLALAAIFVVLGAGASFCSSIKHGIKKCATKIAHPFKHCFLKKKHKETNQSHPLDSQNHENKTEICNSSQSMIMSGLKAMEYNQASQIKEPLPSPQSSHALASHVEDVGVPEMSMQYSPRFC